MKTEYLKQSRFLGKNYQLYIDILEKHNIIIRSKDFKKGDTLNITIKKENPERSRIISKKNIKQKRTMTKLKSYEK